MTLKTNHSVGGLLMFRGNAIDAETARKNRETRLQDLQHVATFTIEELETKGAKKWEQSSKMNSYLEGIWGSIDGRLESDTKTAN